MFKRIFFTVLIFAGINLTAFADSGLSSLYLGYQGGIGSYNYKANEWTAKSTDAKFYNDKFASRFYAGYYFDENLGTELGYTYYNKPGIIDKPSGTKEDFSQHGVDLVARAVIPFSHSFGAYLKAGGTWIYRGELNNGGGLFIHHGSNDKLALLLGGALTLNCTNHIFTDLSWTRIFRNGDLPNTNFYAWGLGYRF